MFDDLMNQIFDIDDIDQDDAVDRQNAEKIVEEKFRKPLYGYKFGPRADVCFECKFLSLPKCSPAQCSIINPLQLCIDPKLIIRTR
jgi:hypothetical protein